MPLAQLYTDIDQLITEREKVGEILHNAIKSALGKPDQYITVMVCKTDYISVQGQSQSVVIQVDSIGGSLGEFVKLVCEGLAQWGVDKAKVTATFRSVNGQEFAMNGKTIF